MFNAAYFVCFFLPLITVQLGKERVGYLLPPRPIGRGLSTNPLVSAGALTWDVGSTGRQTHFWLNIAKMTDWLI